MIKSTPHLLNHNFNLQLSSFYTPPKEVLTKIDDIWAEEKRLRGDRLTNGRIYSLFDHNPNCLVLQEAEYRHVLARRKAPELVGSGMLIRPVAVTGVLLCADGLVLGRRGDQVASDADLWEPAPAGGLNRPDPVSVVLEELREELGLDPSIISTHKVCGLVEDSVSGVFDIVFRLQSAASAKDIRTAYETLGSNEYAELKFLKLEDISDFLDVNHDHLLPALRPMLQLAELM